MLHRLIAMLNIRRAREPLTAAIIYTSKTNAILNVIIFILVGLYSGELLGSV